MSDAIGTFSPAEDYIHPEMQPIVDAMFAQEPPMVVEAHKIMKLSIDYAQRLKYAARLVGHLTMEER
jgi:hypothetical protein